MSADQLHLLEAGMNIIGEMVDLNVDDEMTGEAGKPDLGKIGAFRFDVIRTV